MVVFGSLVLFEVSVRTSWGIVKFADQKRNDNGDARGNSRGEREREREREAGR